MCIFCYSRLLKLIVKELTEAGGEIGASGNRIALHTVPKDMI
jgi:hypothetical protein